MRYLSFHAFHFLAALLQLAGAFTTAENGDPVVTVLLESIIGVTFAASVVTVEPTATLYHIECATTATTPIPSNLCSELRGLTVYEGPVTYSAEFTAVQNSSTFIEIVHCNLTTSNSGICMDTFIQDGVASTFASTYTDVTDSLSPITITAGAYLLSNASASSTTGSGTLPLVTKTGSQSQEPGPTTSALSSANGTAATVTTSAGVPREVQWGILGIVMAIMLL